MSSSLSTETTDGMVFGRFIIARALESPLLRAAHFVNADNVELSHVYERDKPEEGDEYPCITFNLNDAVDFKFVGTRARRVWTNSIYKVTVWWRGRAPVELDPFYAELDFVLDGCESVFVEGGLVHNVNRTGPYNEDYKFEGGESQYGRGGLYQAKVQVTEA